MTAEQLRNSILQEAISGRLVPQDPNDEPVSALLARIREEKARLVKEGKLKKKDLIETPIKEEEIPFEIPSSWEWVRLGYLVDFSKSSSVKASSISPNAWILDLEDIQKNTGALLRKKRMGETVSISDKHQFKKGNVLYSKLRPYLNKVIIADEDGYCTSEILCFNFGEINNRYAQLFLMSAFFVDYAMKDAYGVKMPRLGSKQGNNALFPLPPLAEQKRIVAKLEELLPIVEQYGKAQKELDELNAALPARLRQSILQQAISGRLVPQDPNDELAEKLLDRLNLEKKDLVTQKILKKQELDNYELEDLPEDIPAGWKFVKLRKICTLLDGEKKSGKYICMDAKFLRGKSQGVYLASGKFVKKGENVILVDGENSGEIFVAPIDGYMGSTFKQLWISKEMYAPYVEYLIKSFKETLRNDKKGAAIPHLKKELFFNLPIGIPPLAEQQRIVAKIEELFAEIDKIKKYE